jgi:hypothetical protein
MRPFYLAVKWSMELYHRTEDDRIRTATGQSRSVASFPSAL